MYFFSKVTLPTGSAVVVYSSIMALRICACREDKLIISNKLSRLLIAVKMIYLNLMAKQIIGLVLLLVGLVVGLGLSKQITKFFSEATGQPAAIIVEADQTQGRLPRPWLNLAQGGESSAGMLTATVDKVKALEPEYIRLDHIYDFYNLVSQDSGGLRFDWTKLDTEVDAILATGAKPFLSLSYLPSALADNVTDAPGDWNDWQLLVTRTIEHYSGINQKNIDGVYYEVWNEPDLFGGWKLGGAKNYLTLYENAAQGAAATNNVLAFKFGGPATSGFYPNWIEGVFKLSEEKNLRLDFISWHRYSLKEKDFADDVENLTKLIARYPRLALKERIVSEWGLDSANNPAYDGQLAAAHAQASIGEMFNLIHKAFMFEIVDGLDPNGKNYWGRFGILTHPEKGLTPKLRYQWFDWIKPLGTTRIKLSGEGSWVKAVAALTDAGSLQVYLVNYDPAGNHFETVPVTIKNLTPGPKTITIERFNGPTQTKKATLTTGTWVDNVTLNSNELVRLTVAPAL